MINRSSTLTDVAFAVCTALDVAKITAVLTGGSAATYYAPDAYQSDDLDFVITFNGAGGEAALKGIGYSRKGNYYTHPKTHFPIEFPPGPLAIGEDLVTKWSTTRRGDEVLHVLTPQDSVRDRLASYLFWNDLSGLEQALAVQVAHANQVEVDAIRKWCRRENQTEKFALYALRLQERLAGEVTRRSR